MAQDDTIFQVSSTDGSLAVGFCGGGPIPSAWVPGFQANPGATFEVHQYDLRGQWLQVNTYVLGSNNVGVIGLTDATGRSWLQNLHKGAKGFIGYARSAPIWVNRSGLVDVGPPGNPILDNGPYYYNSLNTLFTDQIPVNGSLSWGLIAGSTGFKILASGDDENQMILRPLTSTYTQAAPNIPSSTSTSILAAGDYAYVELINNSAGNTIAIRLDGGAITSMTPSSANPVILLNPGQNWYSNPNSVPNTAITAYQTSGATINSLTVVTG